MSPPRAGEYEGGPLAWGKETLKGAAWVRKREAITAVFRFPLQFGEWEVAAQVWGLRRPCCCQESLTPIAEPHREEHMLERDSFVVSCFLLRVGASCPLSYLCHWFWMAQNISERREDQPAVFSFFWPHLSHSFFSWLNSLKERFVFLSSWSILSI